MEQMYSVREAAQMLGISVSTLRKWVCFRKIPHRKVGKNVKFTVADLQAAVKTVQSRR